MRRFVCIVAILVGGCLPDKVKELNNAGVRASSEQKYDVAVAEFRKSLAIEPDQPEIRAKLQAAEVLLTDIYVYRIYELVDGPSQPIEQYRDAWQMASELEALGVKPERVTSIKIDLEQRFTQAEGRLHQETEPHRYLHFLIQMQNLYAREAVRKARHMVEGELTEAHLAARGEADAAKLSGLALLHTLAAATFARSNTELWRDALDRQRHLVEDLGIPLALQAETADRPTPSDVIGGLRARLPQIFLIQAKSSNAALVRAARPDSDENKVVDRRSAQCQTGTRVFPNPACASFTRAAQASSRAYETNVDDLSRVRRACAGKNSTSCDSQIRSVESSLNVAQRDYEAQRKRATSCPPTVVQPIYETLFYERWQVTRTSTIAASAQLLRNGDVVNSENVRGHASATDEFGAGLACAHIGADALSIESFTTLEQRALEMVLDQTVNLILGLCQAKAERQIGGKSEAEQLDGLVRARLVDERTEKWANLLKTRLQKMWSTDFGVTKAIIHPVI